MRILVVGSGGREHALCWKIAASPLCDKLYCAPGNAGIARQAECVPIGVEEFDKLVAFATGNAIDLVVVGPEAPLVKGLADRMDAAGVAVFGPSMKAAEIEGSKGFMKDLCAKYRIPTARYRRFTNPVGAKTFARTLPVPVVIKADGLAAGKGVVIAASHEEADAAIEDMMLRRQFGQAGDSVVVEEFLVGEELSFFALCDGETALAMASAQDHKRVGDGDTGPNTGGMGAYSPAPVVTPNVHARVMHEIVLPTIAGMAKEGMPFTGFLYAGLMIDARGRPFTVEFNARLGDPEAQPILMRLKSDLLELLLHATDGTLDGVELQWDRRVALGVVMAAAGYPLEPRKGDAVTGLPAPADDLRVFHAGTAEQGGQLVTSGGRVLCVTALGDKLSLAQARAYDALADIRFDGAQFRSDIGHRALKR